MVLEELKDVAHAQWEKALAEERGKEDADGDLCVRVVEAEYSGDISGRQHQTVCIELECEGHPWRTLFHEMERHLVWNETIDFAMRKDSMLHKEAYLRVAIRVKNNDENGGERLLCTRTEPVANLRDQRVQHRWCDFHNGWRINLSLQWIHSRSSILEGHFLEFQARYEKEHEKLVREMDYLQHHVPDHVWHS